MIDNFELIERELCAVHRQMDDWYYHLQVIQRRKDCDINKNSHLIRAYQVDATHPLSRYKDEVIDLCEKFRARAYINPSVKSKRATAVQMLNSLADCFRQNNFQYLNRLWNSAAGQVGAAHLKFWIVDCDYSPTFTEENIPEVIEFINNSCQPTGDKYITTIPTRHGKHIITTPFDLRHFREAYPAIDVHKNNPTVLYIPKSIE